MSFGSVVRNILRSTEPLADTRAGYGRDVIGFGATAVTVLSRVGARRFGPGIVALLGVEGAPRARPVIATG